MSATKHVSFFVEFDGSLLELDGLYESGVCSQAEADFKVTIKPNRDRCIDVVLHAISQINQPIDLKFSVCCYQDRKSDIIVGSLRYLVPNFKNTIRNNLFTSTICSKNKKVLFNGKLRLLVDYFTGGNGCLSLNSCDSKIVKNPSFSDQHATLFDVSIVVSSSDVRIPCHKLILSLASSVFKAMFENQMQESVVSNEIVISDISEEVVRSFLKCIYDQSAVGSELELYAEQLLLIANRYDVSELVHSATAYITNNISVDNSLDVLIFANTIDNPEIKEATMKFMARNAKHFLKLPDLAVRLQSAELLSEFHSYLADTCTFGSSPLSVWYQ